MSNPQPQPSYITVDPTALTIPTDDVQVPNFYQNVKDILIAINHNLATYMQTTSQDLTTAEATLQNHDNSLSNLDTLMVKAMADLAKLAPGTTMASSSGTSGTTSGSRRAPKLSEPAKFDGSDKNRAVSFRVAVAHYLQVSYPHATVDEQIAYIISCLDGKAHEWLEPYLEQDVVAGSAVAWLHDMTGFWE